jgi:hypothetical protein
VLKENYHNHRKVTAIPVKIQTQHLRKRIHKKRRCIAVNHGVKLPDHTRHSAVRNDKCGNMDIVFTTFKQFISDLVLGTYFISVAK